MKAAPKPTADSKPKALTDAQKIGVLAGMLLFVVQGLRQKTIKSKPILLTDPEAENWDQTSLESEIWKVLGKCGITERKNDGKAVAK